MPSTHPPTNDDDNVAEDWDILHPPRRTATPPASVEPDHPPDANVPERHDREEREALDTWEGEGGALHGE